jgi:putative transposase
MNRVQDCEIVESPAEIIGMIAAQNTTTAVERLMALYLLKVGKVTTLRDLATVLGRDYTTLFRWLRKYRTDGITGMLTLSQGPRGRKAAIPGEVLEKLRERLDQPTSFTSYKEVQGWLRREYGINASYKVVHEAVRYRLKVCLKPLTRTAYLSAGARSAHG